MNAMNNARRTFQIAAHNAFSRCPGGAWAHSGGVVSAAFARADYLCARVGGFPRPFTRNAPEGPRPC